QQLLRYLCGVFFRPKIREQDDELVSTHASDGIGFANAGLEAFGNLAEDDVSGLVSEGVVHPFEVVEVKHHDGERVLGASAAFDGYFEAVAEQGAGGKAGEGVVMRDVVDVLVGALAFGEVVEDSDVAGDGFFTIAECSDDKLHGNMRAIFPDIRPLPLVYEASLGGKAEDMMIGKDFGVKLG